MARKKPPLETLAGLVKAIDWYDVSLQTILKKSGMTSVNRTQSMILIHISNGVSRPSEIAREMGTTRQNIHSMAKHLIEHGIIKLVADPEDKRSKQYAFSEDSADLRSMVLKVLAALDRKLADRIGKDTVKALNRAVSADWGSPISEI